MALQYMMTDTSGDAERRRLRGRRKVGRAILECNPPGQSDQTLRNEKSAKNANLS